LICLLVIPSTVTTTTTFSIYPITSKPLWDQTTGPATTSMLYDCEAGFTNAEMGWSVGKKLWCCQVYGRGCAPVTTSRDPLDCRINGNPGAINAWSLAKKNACCLRYGMACSTRPPPVTSVAYDCHAGFNNWVKGWSTVKKVWCCHERHLGCPGQEPTGAPTAPPTALPTALPTSPPPPPPPAPTTSLPFDCNAGYHDCYKCLQRQWSVAKLVWCCQHAGRGCPTTSAPVQPMGFDCNAGYSNWVVGWSLQKKQWCCEHGGRGCPPTPMPL